MKIKQIIKNKLDKLLLSSGFKKIFVNISWLFFERIIGMIVSFFVGVYVARYLGPENFGLFSYSVSFVGLFAAIATLGLDSIVIRELVKDEKKRDELLGTSFALKIIGSFLVIGIIFIAVRFTNNDNFTNFLIYIIAIGTLFQSFNVINFHFQSKVLSKYTVYAQIFTSITCAAIKLLLIYFRMSLVYFVIVSLIQSVILALGLIVMYIKQKSNLFNWIINFSLAKRLLQDSWPLILSGIAISIAMRIDQVMLKEYMGNIHVGYYAVGVRLAEILIFIPMAIGQSFFPKIIKLDFIKEKKFLLLLFRIFFLLALIAIGVNLLSKYIILFLFGEIYSLSTVVLNILIWTIPFTYFGIITNKLLLSLNLQKLIFYKQLSLTIINICLNIILIPKYGITGAALSTLTADIIINIFYECLFRETRWLFNLKIQSLLFLKGVNS